MGRNLKYQFYNAINRCFSENVSKHSCKKNNDYANGKIFSYSDRKNVLDVASDFANYLQKNTNVKYVKDITSKEVQDFLNSKTNSCSQLSLKQYYAKMNKIEKICQSAYPNSSFNFGDYYVPKSNKSTAKLKDKMMTQEDYNKLKLSLESSRTFLKYAIEVGYNSGLRVAEIAKLKSYDIQDDYIQVRGGKGGKDRKVYYINTDSRRFFKSYKEELEKGLNVPAKASILKAMSRQLEKLGMYEEYKNNSFHAIRKLYAQRYYDKLRYEGYSISDAWGKTSLQLGHSYSRDDLYETYIMNRW